MKPIIRSCSAIALILVVVLSGCAKVKDPHTQNIDRKALTPIVPKITPKVTTTKVSSLTSNNNSTNDIETAVKSFKKAISNTNLEAFKELISPSGLVVIRNFVSGGFGERGNDIRDYYSISDIPLNIQFLVEGETPIKPSELFEGTIKSETKMVTVVLDVYRYNFRDNGLNTAVKPSTNEVIKLSAKMLEKGDNEGKPQIINLGGKEFVLSEAQLIDGLPLGSFAIFEKNNGKYFLRSLVDLR